MYKTALFSVTHKIGGNKNPGNCQLTKHDIMSTKPKTAVVFGATNGIGKAISHRLAGAGFKIVAVGRDRPGRSEEVINELNKASGDHAMEVQHEFRPCDAFQLSQVKECAEGIARDYGSEGKNGIDALVMTQGMATIQSYTPTSEVCYMFAFLILCLSSHCITIANFPLKNHSKQFDFNIKQR